jgi:aspartyl-tRNA synthetase
MHAYRTHNCGELRASNVGETVRLSGWIHRKRDHGGVLFVDLRDHYGLTQIVCKAGSEPLRILEHLRAESVVTVTGEVVSRGPEAANPNLPTGEIEVSAETVASSPPPRSCRCRSRARPIIRRISAFATDSSTCAASGSTPTSCFAAR